VPDPAYRIYLDLVRSELQATSACEGAIQLRSHGECCSNARVGAKCAAKLSRATHALQLSLQAGARPVDPVWRLVSDRHGEALTGFNRLARCHMMLAPGR
jgi:hypothetical protein